MHRPRARWLVLVWMLLLPAVTAAQERRALSLGPGEAPVSVFADRIESSERDKLLIAEGRVEIEQNEIRLEADRVEVNTETGEAVATGRVVLFDGRDRLIGERLEYNFRTGTGVVYRAEGNVEPHFFFGADRMERFGDKAYRLARGVFTTCESETPAWSVRLGSATAYLDDWIWGTNASFWVWKIPLVPFIPVFAASLRKDRHTGLLTPTFSNSNVKGFSIAQPIFWAISDSQDLTVVPTYFTERGVGLGAAYRYVRREGSRGELEGFGLYDTEQDKLRGVIGFRHDEQLTPRLTLRADVAWVSDRTYFSDFGDSLDERSRQRLESNLSLTQRWEKWNLVARLFTYQDLTTPEPIELQRLPEIRLNAFQQPVPGVPGLLYELEASYNNFVRDVGSGGQRFDLRPRLTYPVSPGGFFTLTPRVGFRETVYDTRVLATTAERGFVVEETDKDLVSRTLLDAGIDLEARAYRVFDLGGLLGIERVQHAIEPRVSFNALVGDDPSDLPQWDAIDAIRPGQSVTYSLTNRVKARAVADGDQPGRVWEAVRFTLSQTYLVDPVVPRISSVGLLAPLDLSTLGPIFSSGTQSKRLSDVFADLIVEPLYGVRFRATAAFDPYETRIRSATTDVMYEAPRLRLAFGTRHGQSGRLQFLQGAAEAKLGSRWTVRFASNFDVETRTVIENRFEVTFREQCWAITAAFIDRATEDEFHITVNLLELGQYGFGRAFSSLQ